MNTRPRAPEAQNDGTSPTLGDVLYAAAGQPRVPEGDWLQLVNSIAAGNQEALHALYDRAHRIVFTLIMRITQNRETAEELTLDVFHDVWRRAAGYNPAGGTVVGWIMNQARSRAIDRLRFEQRKKRIDPHAHGAVAEAAASGSDEVLHLADEGRRLRMALTALTPDEREAIETAYFAEMTYSQVASQLNLPLGTIKTRIRSALGKLREALAVEAERS